ncbi:hypothetical protein ABIE09_001172 [Lysobacter enzymogenes]|uniref:alpha-lytic protease prodomain-containing protein n=1 Tax=Lysobacter enzymogenes TaxID=69 RepID=UPI00339277AE
MHIASDFKPGIFSHLLACIAIAGAALSPGLVHASDRFDPLLEEALARDLGIAPTRYAEYLRLERSAEQRSAAAKRSLGSSYAGDWIEHRRDSSFRHVIGTSSPDAKIAEQPGVELRRFRHSLEQLQRTFDAVDAVARKRANGADGSLDGVNAWYVDPRLNMVVVSFAVGSEKSAQDFIHAGGADTDIAQFVTFPGTPQTIVPIRDSASIASAKSEQAPIGAIVCRPRAQRGYDCGTITAKNVSVRYGGRGIVASLSQSDACADSADSGGAWTTLDGKRQGVTFGGQFDAGVTGNCWRPRHQRTTWFGRADPAP